MSLGDKIIVVNEYQFVYLDHKTLDLLLYDAQKQLFTHIEHDFYFQSLQLDLYYIQFFLNESKDFCIYYNGKVLVLNTMNKVHLEGWLFYLFYLDCLTSHFAILRDDNSFIIWSVKDGKKIKEFAPDQRLIKIKETQNPYIFLIVKRENEVYQLSLYDLQNMEELDLGLTINAKIEEIYNVDENHSLLLVRERSNQFLYDCNLYTKALKLVNFRDYSRSEYPKFQVKKIDKGVVSVAIDKTFNDRKKGKVFPIQDLYFLKYVNDKEDPEIIPYEPNSFQRHIFFGDNTILITDRDDTQTLLRY